MTRPMPNEALLSFWEHVSELRRTLIQIIAVVICGCILAFCYYQEIFAVLTKPLQQENDALTHHRLQNERIFNSRTKEHTYTLPLHSRVTTKSAGVREVTPSNYLIPPNEFLDIETSLTKQRLVILGPLEGLSVSVKISFWVGLAATSPLWLAFLARFFFPAAYPNERRILISFLIISLLFFGGGTLFAFFVSLPATNYYLQYFNETIGTNLWTLENYLDYTLALLVGNAFAFEICAVILILVHYGFISAETLAKKRRHAIVAAFIIGALLMPPDVLMQFFMALPLVCFYEVAILYARFKFNAKDSGTVTQTFTN